MVKWLFNAIETQCRLAEMHRRRPKAFLKIYVNVNQRMRQNVSKNRMHAWHTVPSSKWGKSGSKIQDKTVG